MLGPAYFWRACWPPDAMFLSTWLSVAIWSLLVRRYQHRKHRIHCILPRGASSFHWCQDRRTEGRQRGGILGDGAATPSPPARASGGALWAPPTWFWAEHWPPKDFFIILSTQSGLSWYYNIVKCGLSWSHWGSRPHAPLRTHANLSRSLKVVECDTLTLTYY